MAILKTTVFICMCIEAGTWAGKEGEVKHFHENHAEYYGINGAGDNKNYGTWTLIEAKEIELEYTPPDMAELASEMVEKFEKALDKHRAEAFSREQFLKGRIAKFQALTYNGESAQDGEIIPACEKPREDDDADDAEFKDIPWRK